ncbi:hypothetical protein ASC89_04415 [Devosia sp. Root413D1]|uniref:hypothetical protein n=1 Tax=Devosia sp. Root413D1 TaxID=1736531 RepID=UPI0006FCF6A1|nr:hypothetical protein [Devosia sp. Root413D1]KQW81081.1 hypothetical protein ASC89_04415 [Devosia sp. Root413D1]
MPKFRPKPPAPSVRMTIGDAIGRARALSKEERPMSQQEVVRDMIAKLDLPVSLKKRLRERHG